MIELSIGFIALSFLAGLLTFLAPCTLPLVPAYLGFISGVSPEQTTGELKSRVIRNAIRFVLGFSLVFITLGVLAGLLGTGLAPYRLWSSRVGGLFVIIFGLIT